MYVGRISTSCWWRHRISALRWQREALIRWRHQCCSIFKERQLCPNSYRVQYFCFVLLFYERAILFLYTEIEIEMPKRGWREIGPLATAAGTSEIDCFVIEHEAQWCDVCSSDERGVVGEDNSTVSGLKSESDRENCSNVSDSLSTNKRKNSRDDNKSLMIKVVLDWY